MNEIQVFNYGETPVRTILKDDEPWWVLADVCRVLEIGNPRNVAARLDVDEKNTVHLTDGIRGNPNMSIINESGLYKVILRFGAVRFRALMNCGNYENISLICGQSCWIWNTALGEPSGLIIRWINLKSALHLKMNALPLAFRSTEPVNLCPNFGSGLQKPNPKNERSKQHDHFCRAFEERNGKG